MLIPLTRFAHVGKYVFTNKAVTKKQFGSNVKHIIGYDSELWAIPGGEVWDTDKLVLFAFNNGLFVGYEFNK